MGVHPTLKNLSEMSCDQNYSQSDNNMVTLAKNSSKPQQIAGIRSPASVTGSLQKMIKSKKGTKAKKTPVIQTTNKRLNEHILNMNTQFKTISQSLQSSQAFLKLNPTQTLSLVAAAEPTPATTMQSTSYTSNVFPQSKASNISQGNNEALISHVPSAPATHTITSLQSLTSAFSAAQNSITENNQTIQCSQIQQ